MDRLPISVIVVAKNAESTIGECLEAVQRNNPVEIIVVDGNSSDGTVDIARRYTQKIHADGGRGPGVARQVGVEKATEEYVVFLDSDVILDDGALSTLLREFQGSDCVTMHALGELRPQRERLSYWEWAQGEHAKLSWLLSERKPRLGTASCIFRRETILKYRFDETSYTGGHVDDIDLEMRLLNDGHRLGMSSARVYFHYDASRLGAFVKHRFLYGRVAVGYLRKYGIWHAKFWPPLGTLYWLGVCVVRVKPKLVPYFVVDGIAETAGMTKGFLDWAKGN